jgi:hypothetical protein
MIGADSGLGTGGWVVRAHGASTYRAAVRGWDDFFQKIAVFGRISRVFSIWTRCAGRVTGAHRLGGKWWSRLGLWVKKSPAAG